MCQPPRRMTRLIRPESGVLPLTPRDSEAPGDPRHQEKSHMVEPGVTRLNGCSIFTTHLNGGASHAQLRTSSTDRTPPRDPAPGERRPAGTVRNPLASGTRAGGGRGSKPGGAAAARARAGRPRDATDVGAGGGGRESLAPVPLEPEPLARGAGPERSAAAVAHRRRAAQSRAVGARGDRRRARRARAGLGGRRSEGCLSLYGFG